MVNRSASPTNGDYVIINPKENLPSVSRPSSPVNTPAEYYKPVNLSTRFIETSEEWIEDNLLSSDYFLQRVLISRCANLALAPTSLLINGADTVMGLAGWGFCLLTLGQKDTCGFTVNRLHSSRKLLSDPFKFLVRAINPYAEFKVSMSCESKILKDRVNQINNSYVQPAMTFGPSANGSYELQPTKERSFFSRHIGARFCYAMALGRIPADALFKTLYSPFMIFASTITCGKHQFINDFAYTGLSGPGLIEDLFLVSMKLINPNADTPFLSQNADDDLDYADN